MLSGRSSRIPVDRQAVTAPRGQVSVIPHSTKPGFYYLLACAADLGDVTESNEMNNCFTSFAKIRVR